MIKPTTILKFSGIKSEKYLSLNPLSQVPTFKTKDDILTESAAILQHIGFLGLDRGMAYKQGTQKYDHLNQVMAFLTTSLHTSIGPIIHPDRSANSLSAQQDVVQKAKTESVPTRFKHIEQMINTSGWLADDHPTIADAYFYGVGRAAKEFINFEKDFPKIANLFFRFKSDPGAIFAQAIEDQKPPKTSLGFKGELTLSELV